MSGQCSDRRGQAGGERQVTIGVEQRQQVALLLDEMGFEARQLRVELGLRPAREQMPAEAQCGVMLTGQLGETAVAFHGGSLRQLLEEEYQTPLLKSQFI